MRVLFFAASVKVVVGILASVVLIGTPAPGPPALPTWYYVSLLAIFLVSGTWLFVGGSRDARARTLAALFVLFASLFADRIIVRAAVHAPDVVARVMPLFGTVQLVAFCPYAFWRFTYMFPRAQSGVGPRWMGPAMEYATLVTGLALVIGNLLALVSPPLQPSLSWTSQYDDRVFWQALTTLSIACLWLLIVKWRRAALNERRRLTWVVAGIAVGNLPMLAHIVLVVAIPGYAAFAEEPETSRALGIILTMFTLVIPMATMYAVVEEHALDVSFVVRRAVQYALAKYTVIAATAGVVIAVAAIAYGNRSRPLAEIIARSPLAMTLTVLLVILLLSRRALLSAIDRRFFRDQYDARQILINFVERSQSLHSTRDVMNLLVGEVGRALHLERVALLTLDDTGDTLGDSQGRVRSLSLSGPLGAILSGSRAPLDVDLSSANSALLRLPEEEREWLADAGARLIVPLFGVRDRPIGVLVLGDKRSELPFTDEDKRLMTAVAASAALAIEQQFSRESPNFDTPSSIPRSNAAQCTACGRVQGRSGNRCHACNGSVRDALLPIVLSGKFEIEQQIGAGGMGVVYRGRDLSLSRPVALKVLPRIGTAAAARLRREARAMAALQHPQLAVIHGMESWRGAPVLVLEYLAGGTLADRLRSGPLPVDDVLPILTSMAEVLRHIHNAGYLHRDIKPSNVGFTSQGALKLLDFGLAQMIADASEQSTITFTASVATAPAPVDSDATQGANRSNSSLRQFFGTPAYMSPEAIAMESPGPSVDLWSLAVTIYEAVTGVNPFRAPSMPETIQLVASGNVPDARVERPDCPAALAEMLARALSRNRHQRPQTAGEILAAVASVKRSSV
jgi:hypothetical protein